MFKSFFKKRPMIRIEQKGAGITPETGYHVYFKNKFVACFRTRLEAEQFTKSHLFAEIFHK